jgi:hypothetical protein
MRLMSTVLFAALIVVSAIARAQVSRSDLQPLPEPPPMPEAAAQPAGSTAGAAAGTVTEPQVTVRRNNGEVIEEYRVAGRLTMIRVTPAHGVPYVLTDPRGDGSFSGRRDSLEVPPTVPMWVLFTF